MNIVTLIGRLTAAPELKTSKSGVAVTTFTVACDRAYQEKGADRKCDFIPCVAWRQTAEFVTRWFQKGSPIFVVGELQTRDYTDKDGIKRYVTEIIVDKVSFTGAKSGSDSSEGNPARETAKGAGSAAAAAMTEAVDDEYPF